MTQRFFQALACLLCVACVGSVQDGGMTPPVDDSLRPDDHGPVSTPKPGAPFTCGTGAIDPGASPLLLLPQAQYLATVRDLVGVVPNLNTVFGTQTGPEQGAVSQVALENYQRAADLIAAYVAGNATVLATLAPCNGGDVRACAQAFVQSFGARAYRGPLAAEDVVPHLRLYDAGAASGGYAHGIELLLRGMLQASRFLYRVELGTGERVSASAVKLSGYEIAARLSYSVWGTAPDAALTAAAARGELATRAGVAAQLGRMLQDARGKNMVRSFLETWISLPDLGDLIKDPKLYPEWQRSSFVASVRTQAQTFFDGILRSQGGRLEALLTSPTVWTNKEIGPLYGTTGGTTFQPVDRPDGTVSGMLTLPALMASLAKPDVGWPIYRGQFVREQLLCQQLPPPPDNVGKPPEPKPGVTTRQRLAMHRTDPACGGCHALMDPIGFGFEKYDGIGRYRVNDGVGPIDARGEIAGTDDVNGTFDGVAELGRKLSGSVQVQACVVRQWFRQALHRFEQAGDACSLKTIFDGLRVANGDIGSLPAAFVQTDAFMYRRPLVSEVSP